MEDEQSQYTIEYWYADYHGTRRVVAGCVDEAIAKVRRWCRENSSLTLAYESYKLQQVHDTE